MLDEFVWKLKGKTLLFTSIAPGYVGTYVVDCYPSIPRVPQILQTTQHLLPGLPMYIAPLLNVLSGPLFSQAAKAE